MTVPVSPDSWPQRIGEFAALFGLVYAVTLGIMAVTGFTVMALNRRHPERRIQTRRSSRTPAQDIKASLAPLATTSLCLSIGLFAQYEGWAPAPWRMSWWSIPVSIAALIVLQDAWFYWTHRLLHTRRLYRFHKQHHLNTAPSILASDDSTVVDTLFAHTFYALVVFVVPVPALILVIHRVVDQVSGMIGHAGFEHFASPSARAPWPMICTVFHDQHHQFFVANYGIYTSMWDRLCGTVHPSYDDEVQRLEAVCGGPPASVAIRKPA
jgi:sterol desaturase/sphingolipid hydroxylase (fatty acid hydroxylase superfamily)